MIYGNLQAEFMETKHHGYIHRYRTSTLSVVNVGDKETPSAFRSLLDSRPKGPRLTTNEQNKTN